MKKHRKDIISCCIVCLGGLSHGSMLSWPAETLQQLEAPNSVLGFVDNSLLSWIASVNFLGCMIGSLLSSVLTKVTKQKILITAASLVTGISWIMVGLSTSVAMLCISRLMLGCGNAILMSIIPTYITQTSPKQYSGFLSSMYALSLGFGLIYSVAAGRYMSWTLLSFIASSPAILLAFSAPFLSYPYEDDVVARLLLSIQGNVAGPGVTVRHPGALFIFLASVFIASGICPLSIFGEYLFEDERTFSVTNITLASNISQVIGGIAGAVAIDKFGRKPVLRAGTWICLLSNIMLSLYFSTVKESKECPTSPGSFLCWSPAVATCLFFLGFGGGIGNIFFVLLGELIPPNRAGKLVPLITFYLNLLQFVVLRTFISVEFILGLTNVFFIQAGVNIFLLFGIGTWIPETKPEKIQINDGISYGTMRPSLDVNRFTTASGSGEYDDECVLNHTSFFTSFTLTLDNIPEDEHLDE